MLSGSLGLAVSRLLARMSSIAGCLLPFASSSSSSSSSSALEHLTDDFGYTTTAGYSKYAAHDEPCLGPRRNSPVCVIPNERSRLEQAGGCVFALTEVFENMVLQGLWTSRYAAEKRDAAGRAIATGRLVANPSCDASNVVAGAFSLYCAHFADRADAAPRMLGGARASPEAGHLGLAVRLRLAACLSIVYKFERGTTSFFRRRFFDVGAGAGAADTDDDDAAGGETIDLHTRELACVAYNFLYREEQARFGCFSETNAANVKGLYYEVLRIEADLLRGNSIFSSCTRNAQVVAEDRLERLFQSGAIGQWELMEVREFTPIFFRAIVSLRAARAWEWGEGVLVGGLVLAAIACRLARSTATWSMAAAPRPAPDAGLCHHFAKDERACGRAMLDLVCNCSDAHAQASVLRGLATPSEVEVARRVLGDAMAAAEAPSRE